MSPAAALALLLACAARTEPPRVLPGWAKQPGSLVLYAPDGSPDQEIPLRGGDEGVLSRQALGGVSPDARLAWTFERKTVWNPARTKMLESRRLLRVYGADGAQLWEDETAETPERGEPVFFSADAKTLLMARRGPSGVTAEVRTWMGGPIAALGPFPRLISMSLTPNGRFVMARWVEPERSDTHAFLDLATNERKDLLSASLTLGAARIGDDGAVRSGSKTVFAFKVESSSPIAVSTPDAPTPPAPAP